MTDKLREAAQRALARMEQDYDIACETEEGGEASEYCVGLLSDITTLRAALAQQDAQAVPSPTAGMNIAQRILHVGGRNNAAGYVEFGSIQAVEALVRQVLRDMPELAELESLRHNVKVYRESMALALNAAPTPPAQHREPDYTICPTCGGMASDPIVPQEQISDGEFDADKRLMELADKIDHEQNWRLSGIDQRDRLTQEQQDRVTAGVMLRRYADLMAPDSWRLFPPKRLGAGITSFRASTLEKAVEMAMKYQGLNGAIEANLKGRNA